MDEKGSKTPISVTVHERGQHPERHAFERCIGMFKRVNPELSGPNGRDDERSLQTFDVRFVWAKGAMASNVRTCLMNVRTFDSLLMGQRPEVLNVRMLGSYVRMFNALGHFVIFVN
ncbi:hypothetical protein AAC387_Pa10g0307 [Persea americana]